MAFKAWTVLWGQVSEHVQRGSTGVTAAEGMRLGSDKEHV